MALSDDALVSAEEVRVLVHDLQVRQIQLEMQDEELPEALTQLEEGKDRYLDLYDFCPVGCLTTNNRGLFRQADLAVARLLGIERTRLVNTYFSRFMNR